MYVALLILPDWELFLFYQSGQLDLKHFDPEFVREPVPGLYSSIDQWILSDPNPMFMKVCERL